MKNILNILLGIMLVATVGLAIYAGVSGGADAAIGLNLMWAYALLAAGLVAAVICAFAGMATSTEGLKGTIISLVLGIAVIGASYYIASGHSIQIVDLSTGGFFPADDTVITEASVLVTYVVFGASVLVAIVTEIWGALK
ncbi:MAG: hypothetical protein SNG27_01340 [Rikenellaceae bacterium]